MTQKQTAALLECAEALKEIVNAAGNGSPYQPEELELDFAPVLSELYASGIKLKGEL